MPGRVHDAVPPDAVLRELLALDDDLALRPYYGERSVFYNPRGVAPLGTIVASVKEHDGPNDRASRLDRPGVYRLAFALRRDRFAERFGSVPRRPAKGEVVVVTGHDLAALDELTPHPVYAWMGWVQVLSPTPDRLTELRPLLVDALDDVRARWRRRPPRRGA